MASYLEAASEDRIESAALALGESRQSAALPTTSPELAAIVAAVRGVTIEPPLASRGMPVRHGDAITVGSGETAPAGRAGLTEQMVSIGWRSMAAQRNPLLASLQGR